MPRRFLVPFACLLSASSFAQIHVGLFNDFQDGTLMGWQGADLRNEPTGGPAGAGDRYLRVEAIGGFGQGSRLAAHNPGDWAGNYQAAGVTGITLMLNNYSSQTLQMRICLFGATNEDRWTSVTPVIVGPNSGWVAMSFSASESALVRVRGTLTYSELITNVTQLMIRHDAGNPSSGGTSVVAVAGIDNILAVPEPATMGGLAIGLAALLRRKNSGKKLGS